MNVSVALEDGNHPVVVEGRATMHDADRPDDAVAAFKARYDCDITIADDPDVGAVALWQITPIKWLFGTPDT